ncbi:MAG: hypothetical protein NVS3B24_23120 [Candidatus Dormibacteria bacterium]
MVGYSGGPDSMALLHALQHAAGALELDLAAVHVDHGVRGDSAAHAEGASRFAAELGVPYEVVRVRARGRGENALRQARYAALEAAAVRLGAHSIALGHTATDQAETVLLHLLRGSGVGGLAGMRVRDGLRFRPLLEVSRAAVEAHCARHGMLPLRDPSNDDASFTRNRVRHELMPLLEKRFNPRVQAALGRLANAAYDEHAVVLALAEDWITERDGAMPREAFRGLLPAVQLEVLRSAWLKAAGGQRPGGAARLNQAVRLARGKRRGVIQLGSGLELHADAEQLRVLRPGPPV